MLRSFKRWKTWQTESAPHVGDTGALAFLLSAAPPQKIRSAMKQRTKRLFTRAIAFALLSEILSQGETSVATASVVLETLYAALLRASAMRPLEADSETDSKTASGTATGLSQPATSAAVSYRSRINGAGYANEEALEARMSSILGHVASLMDGSPTPSSYNEAKSACLKAFMQEFSVRDAKMLHSSGIISVLGKLMSQSRADSVATAEEKAWRTKLQEAFTYLFLLLFSFSTRQAEKEHQLSYLEQLRQDALRVALQELIHHSSAFGQIVVSRKAIASSAATRRKKQEAILESSDSKEDASLIETKTESAQQSTESMDVPRSDRWANDALARSAASPGLVVEQQVMMDPELAPLTDDGDEDIEDLDTGSGYEDEVEVPLFDGGVMVASDIDQAMEDQSMEESSQTKPAGEAGEESVAETEDDEEEEEEEEEEGLDVHGFPLSGMGLYFTITSTPIYMAPNSTFSTGSIPPGTFLRGFGNRYGDQIRVLRLDDKTTSTIIPLLSNDQPNVVLVVNEDTQETAEAATEVQAKVDNQLDDSMLHSLLVILVRLGYDQISTYSEGSSDTLQNFSSLLSSLLVALMSGSLRVRRLACRLLTDAVASSSPQQISHAFALLGSKPNTEDANLVPTLENLIGRWWLQSPEGLRAKDGLIRFLFELIGAHSPEAAALASMLPNLTSEGSGLIGSAMPFFGAGSSDKDEATGAAGGSAAAALPVDERKKLGSVVVAIPSHVRPTLVAGQALEVSKSWLRQMDGDGTLKETERRLRAQLSESSPYLTLATGVTLHQCSSLLQALAGIKCPVAWVPEGSSRTQSMTGKNSEMQKADLNPVFWCGGDAIDTVRSEAVRLLRTLASSGHSSTAAAWSGILEQAAVQLLADSMSLLKRAFSSGASAVSAVPPFCKVLGVAAVNGGYVEPLRTGAHVEVKTLQGGQGDVIAIQPTAEPPQGVNAHSAASSSAPVLEGVLVSFNRGEKNGTMMDLRDEQLVQVAVDTMVAIPSVK
ncbi:unnamed protein product, partial [Symbiodinium sp. KB8]